VQLGSASLIRVGGHLIDQAAVVVFMVGIRSCSGSIPVSRTRVFAGKGIDPDPKRNFWAKHGLSSFRGLATTTQLWRHTSHDEHTFPLPAGADYVGEWGDLGTPQPYRCFRGCYRPIPNFLHNINRKNGGYPIKTPYLRSDIVSLSRFRMLWALTSLPLR
jgi:hypothetical protein